MCVYNTCVGVKQTGICTSVCGLGECCVCVCVCVYNVYDVYRCKAEWHQYQCVCVGGC